MTTVAKAKRLLRTKRVGLLIEDELFTWLNERSVRRRVPVAQVVRDLVLEEKERDPAGTRKRTVTATAGPRLLRTERLGLIIEPDLFAWINRRAAHQRIPQAQVFRDLVFEEKLREPSGARKAEGS